MRKTILLLFFSISIAITLCCFNNAKPSKKEIEEVGITIPIINVPRTYQTEYIIYDNLLGNNKILRIDISSNSDITNIVKKYYASIDPLAENKDKNVRFFKINDDGFDEEFNVYSYLYLMHLLTSSATGELVNSKKVFIDSCLLVQIMCQKLNENNPRKENMHFFTMIYYEYQFLFILMKNEKQASFIYANYENFSDFSSDSENEDDEYLYSLYDALLGLPDKNTREYIYKFTYFIFNNIHQKYDDYDYDEWHQYVKSIILEIMDK